MLGLFVVMFVVIGHVLLLGYVFPATACIVLAIQFITVCIMKRTWLVVSWIVLVIGSYSAIDVLTYSPDGTSATVYKYMLSVLLAQCYSILLCIACTLSKHRAYRDESIPTDKKVKKIESTLSVFGVYAIPTGFAVFINTMYTATRDAGGQGTVYAISGIITLAVIFGIHVVTYINTVLLVRAITKSDKKEDDKNEVLKKVDNGESIGQSDTGRADN